MSCRGYPKTHDNKFCNAYYGDTPCYYYKPILCINKLNILRPPYPVSSAYPFNTSFKWYYQGWTGGIIKLSKPMRGCSISSKAHAD